LWEIGEIQHAFRTANFGRESAVQELCSFFAGLALIHVSLPFQAAHKAAETQ
jgi:hypothetical protein